MLVSIPCASAGLLAYRSPNPYSSAFARRVGMDGAQTRNGSASLFHSLEDRRTQLQHKWIGTVRLATFGFACTIERWRHRKGRQACGFGRAADIIVPDDSRSEGLVFQIRELLGSCWGRHADIRIGNDVGDEVLPKPMIPFKCVLVHIVRIDLKSLMYSTDLVNGVFVLMICPGVFLKSLELGICYLGYRIDSAMNVPLCRLVFSISTDDVGYLQINLATGNPVGLCVGCSIFLVVAFLDSVFHLALDHANPDYFQW
ncbi:hypothetical protein PG990_002468 [Apiospora arundinis]